MSDRPGQALREAVEASGGTLPCQVDTLLLQLAADGAHSRLEAKRLLSEIGLGVDPDLDELSGEQVVLLRTTGGGPALGNGGRPEEGPLPSLSEWALREQLERGSGSSRVPLAALLERFPSAEGAAGHEEVERRLAGAGIASEPPLADAESELVLTLRPPPAVKPAETAGSPPTRSSDVVTALVFLLACGLVGLLVGRGAASDETAALAARDRAQPSAAAAVEPEAFRAAASRARRRGAAAGRRKGERRGAAAGARVGRLRSQENPIPPPPAPSPPARPGSTPPQPGVPRPGAPTPPRPGTPATPPTPPAGRTPPTPQRPVSP